MALANTDLKKGTVFQFNGQPYKVVEYSQKVMGRGSSIVSLRIKNLIDGHMLEKTFKGNEQIEEANIDTRSATFLYSDDSFFYFMEDANYEQYSISKDIISDQGTYLKENDKVLINFFNDQAVNVELPNNVLLKVTYTEDAVKGDTTTNVQKDATLETGLVIKVPLFIKQGDIVKVDTRNASYLSRSK